MSINISTQTAIERTINNLLLAGVINLKEAESIRDTLDLCCYKDLIANMVASHELMDETLTKHAIIDARD